MEWTPLLRQNKKKKQQQKDDRKGTGLNIHFLALARDKARQDKTRQYLFGVLYPAGTSTVFQIM